MQEMWVRPLGQEDPLEEGMATHCSILACAIPWTEEPGGLQSLESQRIRRDLATEQQEQQSTPRKGHFIPNLWTTPTNSRGKYRQLSNIENGERS